MPQQTADRGEASMNTQYNAAAEGQASGLIDMQEVAFHVGRFLGFPAMSQPNILAGIKAWAAFCYSASEPQLARLLEQLWPMLHDALTTLGYRPGVTQAGSKAQPSI